MAVLARPSRMMAGSHYGDPAGEGRALADGRAILDLADVGVVTVTGPDRLTWLHSLCTQHVSGIAPGVSVEAMILSPQGRVEHVFGMVDDGQTSWLLCETAEALAAHLDRMRFTLRVEVALVTEAWTVVGDAGAAPRTTSGPPAWVDPWPGVVPGGTSYSVPGLVAHPGAGWRRRLTLVPRTDREARIAEREGEGDRLVGTWAAEAARIAAWRPRASAEVDGATLPHELDWLRTAVHLDKGCYRGQETVAKVHNVGRPPRRLTFLHLDGTDHAVPVPGAAITLEGSEVGHITSASLHHEWGPIALALLRRAADPEAPLTVAGPDRETVAASQTPIVNPEGTAATRPPRPGPTARGLLMGRGCGADGGDMGDEASGV